MNNSSDRRRRRELARSHRQLNRAIDDATSRSVRNELIAIRDRDLGHRY